MRKTFLGELISEFIGSWVLLFIGSGCVASLVLNGAPATQWEISIIWGLGVTMAIYITGAVSGTHINPAVTLALVAYRNFPKNKVLGYIIVQILGCFTGAATTYMLYRDAFFQFEKTNGIIRGSVESLADAGIFSTYPKPYLNNFEAMLVEIVITMFLVMVIFAVTDDRNPGSPKSNLAPIMIGLTIAIIGGSFGSLTGFAMNPARDFGPKLFAYLAGWGKMALGINNYFWVPIVGPIIGGLIGGFVYDKGVRVYLNSNNSIEENVRKTRAV